MKTCFTENAVSSAIHKSDRAYNTSFSSIPSIVLTFELRLRNINSVSLCIRSLLEIRPLFFFCMPSFSVSLVFVWVRACLLSLRVRYLRPIRYLAAVHQAPLEKYLKRWPWNAVTVRQPAYTPSDKCNFSNRHESHRATSHPLSRSG